MPADPNAGSCGTKTSLDFTLRPSVSSPTTSLTSAYLRNTTSKPSSPGGGSLVVGSPAGCRSTGGAASGARREKVRLIAVDPTGVAVILALALVEKRKTSTAPC